MVNETEPASDLRAAIERGDSEAAAAAADALISGGHSARSTVEIMGRAMTDLGERFARSEVFLPDIIVAADAFGHVMDRLDDQLRAEIDRTSTPATVALGVVAGDIHDIGKSIVGIMLEAAGFNVIDLGSDVPVETFVEAAERADVIALSSLMSTTMDRMADVVEGLSEAGLRGRVRVLVGGAPITESFARGIGADGYGHDAVEGVGLVKAWTAEGVS